MLDLFNTPVPQNANYQEFYGGGTVRDWVKPRGASMVRMVLIGAGGGGSGGGGGGSTQGANGGGSGAVTSWIGPAIFIPDVLRISVAAGGTAGAVGSGAGGAGGNTSVLYQQKDGTGYTLLTANGGSGGGSGTGAGAGGTVFTNNYFGAAGIFDSIAGQAGSRNANITASTTTFLSGGAGGNTNVSGAGYSVTPNYGYPTIPAGIAGGGNGNPGFFITQPLMLGAGGSGGGSNSAGAGGNAGNGGIGCGGGGGGRGSTTGGLGGRGGDGAVFIWSW